MKKTRLKAPRAKPATTATTATPHAPVRIAKPQKTWRERLRACMTPEGIVRGLLLLFAATMPLYFDVHVPEVSGDMRWAATEFFAGLCAIILLGAAAWRRQGTLSFRQPLVAWFALGLAAWAAISMLDALNWMRGIILIKALYAQILLGVAVYTVATPAFGRRLLWALVLPVFITSWVGIWQFMGIADDAQLAAVMNANPLWWPLIPVVDLLHPLAAWLTGVTGIGYRDVGIATFSGHFFLQSAVPGSTFANKNLAGSWTAMMLPVVAYLLLTSRRWSSQALASVLLALGTLFLVYSRSRASWVSLFAACLTFGVMLALVPAWRRAVARHLDWRHLLWLALPVAVLAYWGGEISPVGAYAVDRGVAQQVEALTQSSWNEIGGRVAYNLNSLAIVKDYWFNGVGLGDFYTIYPPYYDALVVTPTNSYNVMARPQRTHTDLMQAFDEMGIPGGIFYAGVFILGIAMALRMGGMREGALAGRLIGAGASSGLLALALFLEKQNMLALPNNGNIVLYVVFGALTLWCLWRALAHCMAIRAGDRADVAVDDIQLMGIAIGFALLDICLNALMDFPMQLPTAPAAAAMLIGVVTALYVRRYPDAVHGPRVTVACRMLAPAAALVVMAAWGWALYDAAMFRAGNVLLKQAMVRIYSGINDDDTARLVMEAYHVYPYDPRIVENMGVVYANYHGNMPLSRDARIAKLEWVLKSDPYGANHLVNLSSQYLQRAEDEALAGDMAGVDRDLARVEQLYIRLQRVADFSVYTWGIGGLLRYMQGHYEDAASLFRRALAIDPGYLPASSGLKMVALKLSGSAPAEASATSPSR